MVNIDIREEEFDRTVAESKALVEIFEKMNGRMSAIDNDSRFTKIQKKKS